MEFPILKTTNEIIGYLNGLKVGTWVLTEDYYALTTVKIEDANIVFNPSNGAILKAFLNTDTGELRIYLAKVLDVPDREKLI